MTEDYCPACRAWLGNETRIAQHNIASAQTGERSYERAVNVAPRTMETHGMTQGIGIHAKQAYER